MNYKRIGKNIQDMRIARNLTQEELAEQTDTSTSYISNIECGSKKVSLNKLMEIVKVLDTTLDAVLMFEYTNKVEIDEELTEQIKVMLETLNKEQKEEFFILAKQLIEAIKQFPK